MSGILPGQCLKHKQHAEGPCTVLQLQEKQSVLEMLGAF